MSKIKLNYTYFTWLRIQRNYILFQHQIMRAVERYHNVNIRIWDCNILKIEAFFVIYTQRNLIIQYLNRWLKKDILKICSHGCEENNANSNNRGNITSVPGICITRIWKTEGWFYTYCITYVILILQARYIANLSANTFFLILKKKCVKNFKLHINGYRRVKVISDILLFLYFKILPK